MPPKRKVKQVVQRPPKPKRAPRRRRRGVAREPIAEGFIPGPRTVSVPTTTASYATLRVRNTEYVKTITAAAAKEITSIYFCPGITGCLALDGIGKVYDNYRVLSASVRFIGQGPTDSSAVLAACLDYEPGSKPADVDAVLRHVPNCSFPMYRNGVLAASRPSMQRRNWFVSNVDKSAATSEDATAFVVHYSAKGATADLPSALLYIDYDVEFRNPAGTG